MKTSISPLVLTLLIVTSIAVAQKPRRGTVQRKPPTAVTPQPTPATSNPAPSQGSQIKAVVAPVSLVIVNGQTLTTEGIQPDLKSQIDSVDERIAQAKRTVLDLQINTILLDTEAKQRRISSHQLYELEVTKRIPPVTPAQVKQFIEDNKDQFGGMDLATATPQAEAIIHDEHESRLGDALVARLKKTNPVVMGADVTTPNLGGEAVLATIGGVPLKAAVLNERLKPIVYRIRSEAYDIEKKEADRMIDDLLLIAEANRRNIGSDEIIRTEISNKIRNPADVEIAKFYEDNKSRINGDLNAARNQIANYLQEQERARLEKELSDRLRKGAEIRWLISEPIVPVQIVSVDDDPSIGPANAPVTVVEFTDFQCPACAAMHPILDEVLKSYGTNVRFVVRDYPLQQHEWARKAAEAANAARAQGKFFEYAALLFQRQKALDVPSLKKYASELGLNRAKFDAELDKGIYAEEVKHDISDGEIYGVGSTPSIFINGVLLKTLTAEALREAIDRAAVAASKTPAASN
jgi:predicted DsbA family dithiol-disulfide isomerase